MTSHYCRLFKRKFFPHQEEWLRCLANHMRSNGAPDEIHTLPSGLVYFGQFMDHDLTKDPTKLETRPYPEPSETENGRTARFDLDTVYGDGPVFV